MRQKVKLSESELIRLVKETTESFIHKRYIRESERKYAVLNQPRSMGQAFKSNMLGEIKMIPETVVFTTLTEGIDWDIPVELRGGIITFATTVNSVNLDSRRIINAIKKKAASITNALTVNRKVNSVAKKNGVVGLTIGHFLTGKYLDRKNVEDSTTGEVHEVVTVFDEKSLSLEVVGITYEQLIHIAEDMCIEFKQDSVLVKSYETGKILFAYNDELRNANDQFYKLNKANIKE